MSLQLPDYHRYLALSPGMRRWGVGVTGAGVARIAPSAPYPPTGHPPDHFLDWAHGRVLDRLQIVLITAGAGWLETHAAGRCRVGAGMAFLLLPTLWHRYRPDPRTGWHEHWIELTGPTVDELLRAGTFSAASVLRAGTASSGLDEAFDGIHRQVLHGTSDAEPDLAALAMRVLAVCARTAPGRAPLSKLQRAVRRGEEHLARHHAEPVNVEALAASLGVGYSHFRRAFRAQTGFAPWQYVLHLRLTRARRLLASGDDTLDAVAARVGFSSGFHLSLAFKKAYGESPSRWKQAALRPPLRNAGEPRIVS